MIIHIVAGGPEKELPAFSKSSAGREQWIGVDRGAVYLLDRGLVPSRAFGDFDSVSAEEWKRLSALVPDQVQYPAEKNETDLEIALMEAVKEKPEAIVLYGVTGGRLDHFLGAVTLLMKEEIQCPVLIRDRLNEMALYRPGTYEVKRWEQWPYLSFFAAGSQAEGLTLSGFKYPLDDFTVAQGSSRCLSNELLEERGRFSFRSGALLLVRSRDENK